MPKVSFLDQVMRVDGKNCFCEMMLSNASIDKVGLNFVTYDTTKEKGSRSQDSIYMYLGMPDADIFCRDVFSGRMAVLAQMSRDKAKKAGSKYPAPVYELLSGTSGKNTHDGKPVSRQLQLVPGNAAPWVLVAMQGPGKETETGLIAPLGKPTTTIRVPMDDLTLKKFCGMMNRCVDLWFDLKFRAVVEPSIIAARERQRQALANITGQNAAAAAEGEYGEDNAGGYTEPGEDFDPELPFA